MSSTSLQRENKEESSFRKTYNNIHFSAVLASSHDGIIGYDNHLPWQRIPEDMKRFQKLTQDTIMIMGTQTALSLPCPVMKSRITIILTRHYQEPPKEIINKVKNADDLNRLYFCSTLQNALIKSRDLLRLKDSNALYEDCATKVFVIGGVRLFEEAFQSRYCRFVHWTRIHTKLKIHDHQVGKIAKLKTIALDSKHYDLIDTSSVYIWNSASTEKDPQGRPYDCQVFTYQRRHEEYQYLDQLERILQVGDYRDTRNSKTYSLLGSHSEYDLTNQSFPLLTTKFVPLRLIFEELKFFLTGKTNSKLLEEKKCMIWHDNTTKEFLASVNLPYEEGDMGYIYGFLWLHFGVDYKGMQHDYTGQGYNQLEKTIELLKKDPHSRRILMTTFDPSKASQGVLYPCHSLVLQWYAENSKESNLIQLSVVMYQRSADFILGKPFNIASTALLCYLMAIVINSDPQYKGPRFTPGRVIFVDGDTHVYDKEDHLKVAEEQLKRIPYPFPSIRINRKTTNFDDFQWQDVELINYKHHDRLQAKMVA
jgi:thymidylate synthase